MNIVIGKDFKIEEIESICEEVFGDKEFALRKKYEEAIEYVRSFNKDELMKVAASLLKISVDEKIGSDFNKDLTIKENHTRRNVNPNHTRVFLTIGKLDKLKKGTLLDFMKKETGIDKDCFHNIEILTTEDIFASIAEEIEIIG